MGGYAAYVWPAYGASGAALLLLAVSVLKRAAAARRRLRSLESGARPQDGETRPPDER